MRRASRCHLLHFGSGVAIAEEQQIDFVARRAVLDHRPNVQLGRCRAVDGRVRGIDGGGPDVSPLITRAALADDHVDGLIRRREAHAFVEGTGLLLGFIGGLPLAEDAGIAARIDGGVRGAIEHLELIAPRLVSSIQRSSGPGQADSRTTASRAKRSSVASRCGRSRAAWFVALLAFGQARVP